MKIYKNKKDFDILSFYTIYINSNCVKESLE